MTIKSILLLLIIFSVDFDLAIAYNESKICEIKFGEKVNEKELERRMNQLQLYKNNGRINEFNCYQIGVEHDQNRQPISNKPIYACCQNA